MKPFLISYGRFFLLAFALGFLMPRLSPALLQTSVTDYASAENLDTLIVQHHLEMNRITNDTIQRLLESTDANVLYPPSTEECTTSNLSTFCLAHALNQNLVAFETELLSRMDTIEFSGETPTLENATLQASAQKTVIAEQMQGARDALDLTLAVYNQLQTVYPIHQEMDAFYSNLQTFRDQLAELRNVVELYPSRFNGATTALCK